MARYSARRQRRWRFKPARTKLEERQDRWRNYVFKLLRLLGELRNSRQFHGDKWTAGMTAHYRQVIESLLESPPPGCEGEVEDFRRKLRRV